MQSKTYQVTVKFLEPLLGTVPLNSELYDDYIATKAPAPVEDEAETIEEMTEKGTTGFHRLDEKLILYDYVVKGFFKDACGMLRRDSTTLSAKITSHKKVIDGMVFIRPRRIPLVVVGKIGILERPLRAQTAQGERVALSRSETIEAGSSATFTVQVIGGAVTEAVLREWLEYGALRGLGQWRNAGYGAFEYTMSSI